MSELDFGREICGYLPSAERREWLVTNGIGGYASGTVAGLLTRRYHGLLIAALDPPLGRTLLLAKLDETATYLGRRYDLFTNRWADGEVEPLGYRYIERFRLEGTTPVWTFACADALIEKRVWMETGANTTYVQYDLLRGSGPLVLAIKVIVDQRSHHGNTRAGEMELASHRVEQGLRVTAPGSSTALHVLSNSAEPMPDHEWYEDYLLAVEEYRGSEARDDHLYAGHLQAELPVRGSLTVVGTTDAAPELDGHAAYERRRLHEQCLLEWSDRSLPKDHRANEPGGVQQLVLAADQFIVRRSGPVGPEGRTIIAGYPWFGDWGRDTMISLAGLTLITGRYEAAERILRTFSRFVDQGMLPNRFPSAGAPPEYNTVDATLWYFEALRAYHAATGDDCLLQDLFPMLQEIVEWHERGTRYRIGIDHRDGLLYAGEEGVQLTWMDAKVGDWVVTPRIGKPVEINALWYNGLRTMAKFARHLGEPADHYDKLADQAGASFARFWNDEAGFCYDVLDGPEGHQTALRPNQLLAVSLPYSPLEQEQQGGVVDSCARYLLTSHGLRSLSPEHPAYESSYGGTQCERDAAYHQGTVWSWLIGPFVKSFLRVYGDPEQARSYVTPFAHHLRDHGIGSVSEISDGSPPFIPRGCIAQAWSVGQLMEAWWILSRWPSVKDEVFL